MANDYMLLTEFFMDELPEEHPWHGNIKGLIEKLLAAGVTFKRDPHEPLTNGDKLRAMSDKELACFLAGKFTDYTTQRMMELGEMRSATAISVEADLWFRTWMQWLRMRAEGGKDGK